MKRPFLTWTGALLTVVGLAAATCAAETNAPDESPLTLKKNESTVTVLLGGRPLMEYQYAGVPKKPYVKRFFSPAGVNVLRDAPADHLHHHALMFAIAAGGVDFWSENEQCGRQVQRSLALQQPRRKPMYWQAGITQMLDWVAPDGKELLRERRTVEVLHFPNANVSMLAWQSKLAPPSDTPSVELTGSNYFGLGLRMVESMDRGGTHFNAAGNLGPIVRGDERVGPARWSAYTAPVDGRPITIAIFDHPANPRHPAPFFTMQNHFAYIAATLNLWKQPLTLPADKSLHLRYLVVVWDGKKDAAEVERLYRLWAPADEPDRSVPED